MKIYSKSFVEKSSFNHRNFLQVETHVMRCKKLPNTKIAMKKCSVTYYREQLSSRKFFAKEFLLDVFTQFSVLRLPSYLHNEWVAAEGVPYCIRKPLLSTLQMRPDSKQVQQWTSTTIAERNVCRMYWVDLPVVQIVPLCFPNLNSGHSGTPTTHKSGLKLIGYRASLNNTLGFREEDKLTLCDGQHPIKASLPFQGCSTWLK